MTIQGTHIGAARALPPFLGQSELRLLLFGGKGGVGKTTCAAATALHLARSFPHRAFLLVSTDPAHSLLDSLAGSRPPANLEVLELDPGVSLDRFRREHLACLRQIALRGTFLDEDDVERLLELSLPGLDELMAFNDISTLAESQAYGCIIVDTAPTLHTLRLLALPEALRRWIAALDAMLAKHRYLAAVYSGLYRKDEADAFLEDLSATVERVGALLRDPARCCFAPVVVPEALSIEETGRLLESLEDMQVPVTDILVNRVYGEGGDCPMCLEVRRRQEAALGRLLREFPRYCLWQVPLQGAEVRGAHKLGAFWQGVRPLQAPPAPAGPAVAVPPRVECPPRLPDQDTVILLFAGKGGVGKTTLASATALRLAERYSGRQVLLFSTHSAGSLSDCLGVKVGPEAVGICPGLSAVGVDAEAQFEGLRAQYAAEVRQFFDSFSGRVEIAFDRQVAERILDLSPPGLDEVMALTRVVELLEARRYDMFVLDTAPTGHLVRLLQLPVLVEDWLRVFFRLFVKYRSVLRMPGISALLVALSQRLKALRALLSDPRRAQLYAVSILTEMAFQETCDLLCATREAGIHVPVLLLNQASAAGSCRLCSTLAQSESRTRRRFNSTFKDIQQPVVFRCGEPRGIDSLRMLGQALYCE